MMEAMKKGMANNVQWRFMAKRPLAFRSAPATQGTTSNASPILRIWSRGTARVHLSPNSRWSTGPEMAVCRNDGGNTTRAKMREAPMSPQGVTLKHGERWRQAPKTCRESVDWDCSKFEREEIDAYRGRRRQRSQNNIVSVVAQHGNSRWQQTVPPLGRMSLHCGWRMRHLIARRAKPQNICGLTTASNDHRCSQAVRRSRPG
jgi:hypothetical protein